MSKIFTNSLKDRIAPSCWPMGRACILGVGGDQRGRDMIDELGLRRGTYCTEGQLGTTALGLGLIAAMPVQVVGAEHYFRAYHHLVSTAAPIHDEHGRITGILAIIGPASTATSHALSLVMAAARAISNQLQANLYLQEAIRRLTEVNAVLGAMHEGVIAWDATGRINHVNPRPEESCTSIQRLYKASPSATFCSCHR